MEGKMIEIISITDPDLKNIMIRKMNYLSLYAGTQLGEIHVFNVPAKGTNITLKESLIGMYQPKELTLH
jgi:hypothetical protein